MDLNDIDLTTVNWEHGMLLTPEHFLRQERYMDSALLWVLRYATSHYGLVGGGARVPETERGAARYDPIVTVAHDDNGLSVSVTQCRAITAAGCIVEISPEEAIHHTFTPNELEGMAESNIYVTCQPHRKEAVEGPRDDANPQMSSRRRQRYELRLRLAAEETPFSASVARVRRRQHGVGFEKDSAYIPPCTTMTSLSTLAAAWRRIGEEITLLAERFTELNRAMQEFLSLFKERGVETEMDRETMGFVGRMVVALQNCLYEIHDPIGTPQAFFGRLRQFFYSAAVYLDLSPSAQKYFDALKETGETEFIPLIEQQHQALRSTRRYDVHEDLGVEVRAMEQSIAGLTRLERALEGKYLNFRISPSLEAMNFIFDRGGKELYKLAAKQSRLHGAEEGLIFHFANLDLRGRDRYRLILAGEPDATFEIGERLNVEILINPGSGFDRAPLIEHCEVTLPDQHNFEFDFEARDVPSINDLKVTLLASHPIRSALLFVRHRFYTEPIKPTTAPAPPPPSRTAPPPASPQAPPQPGRRGRLSSPETQGQAPPQPEKGGAFPPWEDRWKKDRTRDRTEGRPRRKRLE